MLRLGETKDNDVDGRSSVNRKTWEILDSRIKFSTLNIFYRFSSSSHLHNVTLFHIVLNVECRMIFYSIAASHPFIMDITSHTEDENEKLIRSVSSTTKFSIPIFSFCWSFSNFILGTTTWDMTKQHWDLNCMHDDDEEEEKFRKSIKDTQKRRNLHFYELWTVFSSFHLLFFSLTYQERKESTIYFSFLVQIKRGKGGKLFFLKISFILFSSLATNDDRQNRFAQLRVKEILCIWLWDERWDYWSWI